MKQTYMAYNSLSFYIFCFYKHLSLVIGINMLILVLFPWHFHPFIAMKISKNRGVSEQTWGLILGCAHPYFLSTLCGAGQKPTEMWAYGVLVSLPQMHEWAPLESEAGANTSQQHIVLREIKNTHSHTHNPPRPLTRTMNIRPTTLPTLAALQLCPSDSVTQKRTLHILL